MRNIARWLGIILNLRELFFIDSYLSSERFNVIHINMLKQLTAVDLNESLVDTVPVEIFQKALSCTLVAGRVTTQKESSPQSSGLGFDTPSIAP